MKSDTLPARQKMQGSGREGNSRVTIADVAQSLGLTKGTVSRALNGYPDIAEATRLRVARAAERMGYRPLSHAQAIKTGRVRSMGLVLQMSEHDGHRPFLADFLAGVSLAAAEEDWALTVSTAMSDADCLALLNRLNEERKADGFILPRTRLDDPRAKFLRDAGIPFVLYGKVRDQRGCAWFDIDGVAAMQAAVARLFALGHHRIAFVGGRAEYNFSAERLAGYKAGLAAARIAVDDALIREGASDRTEGRAAALDLLAEDTPPTGFVFALDQAALGLYQAAEVLGISVGQEISVISYDGVPEAAFAAPPLTTFAVDSRFAGARLAALMIRRVRGEDPETLRETAPAHMISGGSDRPPTLTSQQLGARLRASNAVRTNSKGETS